ncbi:unnamed protein product [Ectocarpus sp. 12 AP-2014]
MTLTKPSVDTRMKVLSATPDLVPFPLPWALVPAARPRHPVVDRLRRHQSPMDVLQYPQSPRALRHQGPRGAARLADWPHVGHCTQEYVRVPSPARSCRQDHNA